MKCVPSSLTSTGRLYTKSNHCAATCTSCLRCIGNTSLYITCFLFRRRLYIFHGIFQSCFHNSLRSSYVWSRCIDFLGNIYFLIFKFSLDRHLIKVRYGCILLCCICWYVCNSYVSCFELIEVDKTVIVFVCIGITLNSGNCSSVCLDIHLQLNVELIQDCNLCSVFLGKFRQSFILTAISS